MLNATNKQAAEIIREVAAGGVEPEWQAGIDFILAECDDNPSAMFAKNAIMMARRSGLPLEVCDEINNAIGMS